MGTSSIIGKILIVFMVFVLGFFSCFGILIGGGYLAYSRLTLDGMGVDTDSLLSDDAEVDLTAMSLSQIIAEFASLKKDSLSLALLVDRYGLILPEEVDDFLTDELRTMALSKVFSKDGAYEVLEEIQFGTLFGYEKADNPAYDATDPEKEPEQIWVHPDTQKRVVGVNGVISDITMAEFFTRGIPTQEIMDGLSIGELMELESKANLPIYLSDAEGNLTLVEDIDPIVIWYDSDGQEVATVIGAIANQGIDDLTSEFDELLLGQVLGTVEYKGETYTYDVKRTDKEFIVLSDAESVISEIADLSIEGLSGKELNDRVNNMEVASLLNYTRDPVTGKWKDSENRELNSIMAQIASSTVGTINETLDGIAFGEIADLVAVDEYGNVLDHPATYTGEITWYEKGYELGGTSNTVATGIIASLADLSVAEMSSESEITKAVKGVLVGDAMGYVKDGGVWYTDDTKSTKASNIMAILADSTVGDMNTKVGTITFAEIAGLVAVDASGNVVDDPGSYTGKLTWYEKYNGVGATGNEAASGLMAGLAHLTVDDFGNEDSVSEAVKDLTVGDAMGYHLHDGVWYSEYHGKNDARNKPLTGFVKAIASDRVGELESNAKHVTIADIAGLIAVDTSGNVLENVDADTYEGIWYEVYYGKNDSRNVPTTGLMAGLAHLTMEDLQSSGAVKAAVGEITAGDAMGYKKVGTVWYDDLNQPLTGLVKAIADSKVKNLNTDIQATKFGTVAGLTLSGSTWMDGTVQATGIIASLADLTVAQISDEKALSDAIQKVTVADAMGYTKSGSGYKDKSNNDVTGFMAVIADKPISNIQQTLDETEIGKFMGYEKVGTVWKKKKDGVVVEVDALMQKVCSKTIDGLDGLLDTLVLEDVVETRTGLLSLVPADTEITELDSTFETMFTSTDRSVGVTILELKEKELIPNTINSYFDAWTFAEFMTEASKVMTAPAP
ncbi:MAG: hypothetical protein J6K14_09525 [Clostridia bacterium]|nr:hypothetical protein [Clostridia bacterium]